MEDYIYIIALIAWVVFAFYRKSRKKAEQSGPERPYAGPRTQPIPMPTLQEILLGTEPEPEPEFVPAPAGIEMTDGMSPVLKETSFEKEYNLSGISSVEELDKPMNFSDSGPSEIQKNEIGSEAIDDKENWLQVDIRRAVIYSEILSRPYVW
jgi:hypothetical protein